MTTTTRAFLRGALFTAAVLLSLRLSGLWMLAEELMR